MASCKSEFFYPVLPPNENAVCNSKMTEEGKEGVAKFILTNDDSDQSLERIEKNFHLQELTIATSYANSVDELKSIIEAYIRQYRACLVDGANKYKIKLVLEQEWEELINKLQLEDDVVTDLRLFHIKKGSHNFFMLAKDVSFLHELAGNAQAAVPFAVFLLHSVKPKVEKHARIYFEPNFTHECGVHGHVVRGHIFNLLVALSNGDNSYEDDEGNPYDLTDGSNWEIKDTTGYNKVNINLGSTLKKTNDKLCHICIRGTSSDYRLVFWNQTYNSRTGKETVYVIVGIAQHSDKKMVKKKGDRHSKERRSLKWTASDSDPEALEREMKKIKLVFDYEERSGKN